MAPMQYPSLAQVLERYDVCVTALEQRQRLGQTTLMSLPEFAGMSFAEILATLTTARIELEGWGVLFLSAAAEADLRRDLATRDARSKGDPIRDAAQQLSVDSDRRPRLEDLVDFWRRETAETGHGPGSRFKSLLKRRHWLAHGRSWPDKSGVPIDVADAWSRVSQFYARIRAVDPEFPRL